MSLRGTPDWHDPPVAGGVFAAFELPGVWFAPPARLEPRQGDGIVVDRFAQDRHADGGILRYGVHTLRWQVATDLDAAAVMRPEGDARFRPIPFDGGLVRLTGPPVLRAPGTGEPALGAEFRLDQAALSTFVATVTLDDASTDLVVDAYRRGVPLIGADALLVARGVAARYAGEVEVDLADLAAGLASATGDGAVEVDRLREALHHNPAALGITFTSAAPADDVGARAAAEALLDRLLARCFVPLAPAAREPEALGLGARIPPRVRLSVADAAGHLRWDLREILVAPRLFAMASSALLPGAEPPEVRNHTPPVLASGRHRISVSTTVVPPWAGALLGVEVEVPANPPWRPQTLRETQLFEGVGEVAVDLRLTPLEPLSGTVRGVVVFDTGAQATGDPRPMERTAVVLRSDAFPARLTPLDLAPALADSDVSVRWSPTASGPGIEAHLGARAGTTLILVTPPEDGWLEIRAQDPEGRTATTEQLPVGPLLIDPFVFPGTGAQTLQVEVDFALSTRAGVAFEFVPEGRESDPVAVARRAATRQRPRTDWSRFVGSPFATGYRWRLAGSEDWSALARVVPGTPLLVAAPPSDNPSDESEQDMTDDEFREAGLRLIRVGKPATHEWMFVPEAPSVATGAGGDKATSLVEAGGESLLVVTGRLDATDDQQAAAREAAARRDGVAPTDVVLRPASLRGIRAVVIVRVADDPAEVAMSATSGIWPYQAALQGRLTGEQAAAVKAAWGGRRGLVSLRYAAEIHTAEVTSHGSAQGSFSSSTSSSTATAHSSSDGGITTTSTTSEHNETGGHAADFSDPAPAALLIELDGADWLSSTSTDRG